MLRSSVIEVNEKLQNVDKCLSVLTNLVTALIKASTNPLTSEVSILLQSIDNVCGKKREGIFIENPANDLKRARVIGEATLVDNNYAFFSRCDKIEGDDTNSTGTEALNDCDVKIIPSEQHTDADFDNFLAYIADDDQTPTYDTPGSDPIEFVCAASFPINGRAIAAIERFHNAVSPVLHEPFTRDRFLHTQFVHSKDNSTGHLEQLAGDVPAAFKRITRYRSSENVLQEIIASVEQTRAAPNDYPSAVYVYRTIEQKPGTESPL